MLVLTVNLVNLVYLILVISRENTTKYVLISLFPGGNFVKKYFMQKPEIL